MRPGNQLLTDRHRAAVRWLPTIVLNNNHKRTSFSMQIVSCSRHLCRRRDIQADNHNHPHAKRTVIRKMLQAKFKHMCTEQNRKYLHSIVITKTARKSDL